VCVCASKIKSVAMGGGEKTASLYFLGSPSAAGETASMVAAGADDDAVTMDSRTAILLSRSLLFDTTYETTKTKRKQRFSLC